jgi:pyoverdine/dityrosine biosynthesis protein Dit1
MYSPAVRSIDYAAPVFSILISSAYRKNSLARMELARCGQEMMSTLRRRTRLGLPVQLTLLAFPFKVPNPAKVGGRRSPDSAELMAIRHFGALRDAIRSVYPPGLELHILHDGSLIADVFGIDLQEVRDYEVYFADLVVKEQAIDFIHCHDFHALQQRHTPLAYGSVEKLRLAAQQWWLERRGTDEWRGNFQKTLGMMNLREFPAGVVAALMQYASVGSLPEAYNNVEHRVHRAMVEYHVRDAIIHQFDPRALSFPDAIHATTQDRPDRLALWLVRRGRSLLPWHGVGCFDAEGTPHVVYDWDVCRRHDYKAEFVAQEATPFAYRKLESLAVRAARLSPV